ncbi:MAG TPA: hypothetical protein VHN11_11470 [Xanthobacteraceae bacterium]|jgi:hypothetical protein|nr:hypothetical protein [Xanthobacteraceae bacterium]
MKRTLLIAFLAMAAPVFGQTPGPTNPVTGAPFPSPFQALGNILRGQNPPPPPPSTLLGQPPLPTAIPPFVPPSQVPPPERR